MEGDGGEGRVPDRSIGCRGSTANRVSVLRRREGRIAYNDKHSGDDLSNNSRRKVFAFDNVVEGFGENNDAFPKDDKGKKATPLIDVGMLEANAVPYACTNEHDDGLQDDNNVPTNVGSFRTRAIKCKGQAQADDSTDCQGRHVYEERDNHLLVVPHPVNDGAILTD